MTNYTCSPNNVPIDVRIKWLKKKQFNKSKGLEVNLQPSKPWLIIKMTKMGVVLSQNYHLS